MLGLKAEIEPVEVHTSKPGQPMPAEFWAERAARRIMSVADTAPQPIRDQAYAFQGQVQAIILGVVKTVTLEQKMFDAHNVERVSIEAARIIREG